MKKRGFGAGRWNGFGGKVQEGESVIDAMHRELFEEVGIEADNFQQIGVLDFTWKNKPEILQVHIFKADNFSGEPRESEEMRPEWFDVKEIPFVSMWQDDKYWVPLFLQNKNFQGKFLFDDSDNVLDYSLNAM